MIFDTDILFHQLFDRIILSMIRLALFILVAAGLSGLLPSSASALCNSFSHDKTPGELEFSYICENSYSQPKYKIVQHYFGQNVVGILNFAPFEANVFCNEYEIGREERRSCRRYGMRALQSNYHAKPNDTHLYELEETKEKTITSLYTDDPLFAYPDSPDAASVEGCFSLIDKDKELHIGYTSSDFIPLTQCLIQLELYIGKNRKAILGH